MKKNLAIIAILILLGIGIGELVLRLTVQSSLKETVLGVTTAEIKNLTSDVIGSHVGTSTVGVWQRALSTSTFISKLSGAKVATYQAIVTLPVTSTGAVVNFAFQASNDFRCDTTFTSVGANPNEVIVSDINWFSIGDHLRGKVQSTALTNASSTNIISWDSPDSAKGQVIQLENLNFECIKAIVGRASTTLYMGVTLDN